MNEYTVKTTASSKLREKLDYPVIDADGHLHEAAYVFPDFLKQVGGPDLVERFNKARGKRFAPGKPKSVPWGGYSGPKSLDRATVMLPKLYAMRLEEVGLDFSTVYPTQGFGVQVMADDEVRAASCRALNMMYADMFKDVSDKMTPAAIIPMNTPDEAIAEVEFAVKELGMKALMTCNEVLRPHPVVAEEAPQLASRVREYSPLELDSPYNYDPFWAKCLELKVVPAGHSMNYSGWHASPTNYIYHRLAFFSSYGSAACRALFMGGVTRRFPGLNIAFLEGGVWWAAALYNDLVEFWEKRNVDALLATHDPAALDVAVMEAMFSTYGQDYLSAERFMENKHVLMRDGRTEPGVTPDFLDDWGALDIKKKEDIRDLFVDNFYFGCEADDALNYTAFNAKANQFGAKLKAVFSSDLGHWDVPDFGGVLAEAYEPVEKGLISEEDFNDFVFTNPAMLQARVNPDFFKGTAVEGAVDKLLGETAVAAE